MLTIDDEITNLQSALKRIVRVKEWCGITDLHNVGQDMRTGQKEIESVIYSLQERKKIS